MILTYVFKHNRDFSEDLRKAKQVADFGIRHRVLSSKDVKQFGLKSAISNQVLRKYAKNRSCKRAHRVNLIVPSQSVRVDTHKNTITIPCLDFSFQYQINRRFKKVNQIEISKGKAFVSVTVDEEPEKEYKSVIGVDRNTTHHCVVAARPATGKVLKLGKSANHIHTKYKKLRRRFQKRAKLKKSKQVRRREFNKVQDLNHKMSRKIVNEAKKTRSKIVLEDLKGIRKKVNKVAKTFRYALNSWSYYQFEQFVRYKAKLLGVPVIKVDPRYTSQQCSRCGLLGNREGKKFHCPHCGVVEDADVNAAFVIALRHKGVLRLPVDRDAGNGSTDTPKEATHKKAV